MTQNQINYWRLQEDRRANLAKEAENYRSNKAKEDENYRSNLARETETHRSNVVNEGIAFGNLSEAERSHMAQEDLARGNLDELIRHQMVTEGETNRANIARELENYRHNSAMEAETHRANVADEALQGARLTEQTVYHQQTLAEEKKQRYTDTMLRNKELNKDQEPATVIYVNNPRLRGESGGTGVSTSQTWMQYFLRQIGKGADFLLPGD